MTIGFSNYAMKTDHKYDRDWFEWCVFCVEPATILNEIQRVEYGLHPSFPDANRVVTDRDQRFALFSAGWGEFKIRIKIVRKDGSTEQTDHWLRLGVNLWPLKPIPASFDTPLEEKVYGLLTESEFRWRKKATLMSRTHASKEEIDEILARFSDAGLARPLPNPSIDGQILWGATSRVGVTPLT